MRSRPLAIACLLMLAACTGGGEKASAPSTEPPATEPPQASGPAEPETPVAEAAPEQPDIAQIDACSLLSQADIEALVGRSASEPHEERAGELSICSYGDPDSPKLGERPMNNIAQLSVFTGGDTYFAGPLQQAEDAFKMIEENAGDIEPVAGVGDRAYWTGTILRALRAPYFIEVEVDPASREAAEKIAAAMLKKIP